MKALPGGVAIFLILLVVFAQDLLSWYDWLWIILILVGGTLLFRWAVRRGYVK